MKKILFLVITVVLASSLSIMAHKNDEYQNIAKKLEKASEYDAFVKILTDNPNFDVQNYVKEVINESKSNELLFLLQYNVQLSSDQAWQIIANQENFTKAIKFRYGTIIERAQAPTVETFMSTAFFIGLHARAHEFLEISPWYSRAALVFLTMLTVGNGCKNDQIFLKKLGYSEKRLFSKRLVGDLYLPALGYATNYVIYNHCLNSELIQKTGLIIKEHPKKMTGLLLTLASYGIYRCFKQRTDVYNEHSQKLEKQRRRI